MNKQNRKNYSVDQVSLDRNELRVIQATRAFGCLDRFL